jgi:uncharacterized protein (TIGR00375 family)
MKFFTDLHLHSHYSRATAKDLDLEHLEFWAQLKGIDIAGTGDFTHPAWFKELQEKLEPAQEGLFKLKKKYSQALAGELPKACQAPVRFMLTVEISNIYKRLDKVRKVHNVVFVPHFAAAEKLIKALERIGNLKSDGRPILGLDSRDLLEIVLSTDPQSYLIPAHIWTPWFSALGSKSGFDRMTDCFGDLSPHIFAVETGLSSDPLMNWRLGQLDDYVLVSNGDAHSPQKLGREATIFDTELSYTGVYNALKDRKDKGLIGTVEFYPEEGKYHYDGCRGCHMRLHPKETIKHQGFCPTCGKSVTVGVMARVEELADHQEGRQSPCARPYYSLVPLAEIIADAKGAGVNTKGVVQLYFSMLAKLGNEYSILMELPLERIQKAAGRLIAEGVRRCRAGELKIAAGYDGEFGTIKIYSPGEREEVKEQLTLF